MHDILEGILPHDLKLILNYFGEKGIVSIDELNAKISRFCYDLSDSKSKPSCIVLTREDCNHY